MHAAAGLGQGNRHEPKVHHDVSFRVANADCNTLTYSSALAYYYHERQQWQQQPRRARGRSRTDTNTDTDSDSNPYTHSDARTYNRLQHGVPELLYKA